MSTRPPRTRPLRKPVSTTPSWVVPVAVVAAIALLVAAFLLIRWYTTPLPLPPLNVDATQQVISSITSLPASELDAVGTGSANNLVKRVTGSPLTGPNGHPEVFYMGAEYCPYCAAERWPMIIALSRFGTFSGLKTTSSSSTDIYPNTATFSFRSATFDSPDLALRTTELANNVGRPLQSVTALDTELINRYDVPPYVNGADQSGAVPFLDIDNHEVLAGAQYNPQILAGLSMSQIAAQLDIPASPVAMAIDESAGALIAAIDQALHLAPARG